MDARMLIQQLVAKGYTPEQAAMLSMGVSDKTMSAISGIESGGNASAVSGSYKGLNQLSDSEFRRYGGQGSIFDPAENTRIAKLKLSDEVNQVQQKLGRELTPAEQYMVHQQGVGGAYEHLSNPDRPAWQSMAATAEGRSKGPGWARTAIWGNLPDSAKKQFGSVDNVTSGQFTDWWKNRFNREEGLPGSDIIRTSSGAGGNPGQLPSAIPSSSPTDGGALQSAPDATSTPDAGIAKALAAIPGKIADQTAADTPAPIPMQPIQQMVTPQMLRARQLAEAMLARSLNPGATT